MINVNKIIKRYESYFTQEQLKDQEVINKIAEWTERDVMWKYDEIDNKLKNLKEVNNRKYIVDFVGSAKQIKQMLNLRG